MQPLTLYFLLLTSPIWTASAQPDSVMGFDEIIVVFEERIITKSDLMRDKALIDKLPLQSALLQQIRRENTLEWLVQLELIYHLTNETTLYQPSQTTVEERYTNFVQQWSLTEYRQFSEANGLTDAIIRTIIEKHIIAEEYVVRNIGIERKANSVSSEQIYRDWIMQNKESYAIRYVSY